MTFLQALNKLRKDIPPPLPTQVRRIKIKDEEDTIGFCEKRGKKFYIKIDKRLSEQMAIMILLHEWAHALSWPYCGSKEEDHGPEWGIAYAKVWRAYMETD